ncbi:LINE-1 reverse transcriptase-like [Durusdinium trenchii]|uniref:LINE-1 reverse transcriptase-like n=1 Tax=Durusdinium trenchii TaxID=1381693 RepID=A0ABP0MHU4_9DINO
MNLTKDGMGDLILSDYELSCYNDKSFGADLRCITRADVCPSVLHSYGSALSACPCKCRSQSFSMTSLICKGLRGFYIETPEGARYLHPQELALLLTLSPNWRWTTSSKESLCLLGLVASPLQILWVFSQVVEQAALTDNALVPLSPEIIIEDYKRKILAEYHVRNAKDKTLHTVAVLGEDQPPICFSATTGLIGSEFLAAERINEEWGSLRRLVLANNFDIRADSTIPLNTHEVMLQHRLKRQRKNTPTYDVVIAVHWLGQCFILIEPCGSFLFQFAQQLGLEPCTLFVDHEAQPLRMDHRIWSPCVLFVIDRHSCPTLPSLRGGGLTHLPTLDGGGTSDAELAVQVQSLLEVHDLPWEFYWPPGFALWTHDVWPAVATDAIRLRWNLGGSECGARIGIYWEQGHWVAYAMCRLSDHLIVLLLDGLSTPVTWQIELFFDRVGRALGCLHVHVNKCTLIQQTSGTHCGAIAVLHLVMMIQEEAYFTEEDAIHLHNNIMVERQGHGQVPTELTLSATLPFSLVGSGPDVQQTLRTLLVSKGVDEEDSNARARMLISKLGIDLVTRILEDRNPWQALKANANRPGLNIKILTEQEKDLYIKMRSSTQHGAQVANYKSKKQRGSNGSRTPQSLDPELLTLEPKHFADEDGHTLPQINFDQVGAEQRGLALCTIEQARRFIPQKSFSTHALGLLLTEWQDEIAAAVPVLQKFRFPATYRETGEQVLVFGSLISLGDKKIQRAEIFAVAFRVPAATLELLVKNHPVGMYADPRTDDPKIPHPSLSVIWLNKNDYEGALIQYKTCSFALALVRARNRYGIQVSKANTEKAFQQLKPGLDFQDVKIEKIYEVLPIPHGTQKATMTKILQTWGWKARVLQPGRSTIHHMSWKIGSDSDPPLWTTQAFGTDVIVNLVKHVDHKTQGPRLMGTSSTMRHIQQSLAPAKKKDPWQEAGADPWATFRPTVASSSCSPADAGSKTHLDEITNLLQKDVKQAVQKELAAHTPSSADVSMDPHQLQRLQRLEDSIQNIEQQQTQMHSWFKETQQTVTAHEQGLFQLRSEMKASHDGLQGHIQQAIAGVKKELTSELCQNFEQQFTRLEALLEKRQRKD